MSHQWRSSSKVNKPLPKLNFTKRKTMSYFKVYIINGSGGSGKDTFCNLVWTAMNNFDHQRKFDCNCYGVFKVSC